jgi:outer membrane protein assembly factor BamE (lipoprotein component of BamABCDE complex)
VAAIQSFRLRATRTCLLAGLLTAAILTTACAPVVTVHGYAPSQAETDAIIPGGDTLVSIQQRLGRPSSAGLIGDSAWYYVQTTISQYTYNPPEVIDRTVVAVEFDDGGTVTAVNRYGIADGRVIDLNTRVTETNARKLGILEQLFGNLLNIDAGQFIGN